MNNFIILVTGGRGFSRSGFLYDRLHEIVDSLKFRNILNIAFVQGGAKGADSICRSYCHQYGFPCITVDANWDVHGNRAGSLRNQWMLDYIKPDFVIAMPGGVGTTDMIQRSKIRGVPGKMFLIDPDNSFGVYDI